jgi:hypothetical protein
LTSGLKARIFIIHFAGCQEITAFGCIPVTSTAGAAPTGRRWHAAWPPPLLRPYNHCHGLPPTPPIRPSATSEPSLRSPPAKKSRIALVRDEATYTETHGRDEEYGVSPLLCFLRCCLRHPRRLAYPASCFRSLVTMVPAPPSPATRTTATLSPMLPTTPAP